MKKKSIISLVLATAMVCSLFTGCMGGKTVMKVGGNSISEGVYSGAVGEVNMYYTQYGMPIADMLDQEIGSGMTGADMLKQEADNMFLQFESVAIFAEENGIKLGKEEKDTIEANKKTQYESAGGKKAFLESLAESGVNEAYFNYILERQQLYMKAYQELFTGDGKFAPTAETVAEKMMDGYVRVKHVLVMASEGDEDYAEKKTTAESILARAKAGEDFDALVAEYGEDPGMQTYSEGYLIDENGYTPAKTMMDSAFSTAANALEENGVSDIVTTSNGFHIIKRYPISEEYAIENYESFVNEFVAVAFNEQMSSFMENVEIEYTKAYDEIDVHAILGVEKTLGAGTSSEEHSEDDGHDHGTDADSETSAGDGTDAAADNAEAGIESGEAAAQ